MNNMNSEIYVDISVIISMMPTEMKSKISNNFINFIENNKYNQLRQYALHSQTDERERCRNKISGNICQD